MLKMLLWPGHIYLLVLLLWQALKQALGALSRWQKDQYLSLKEVTIWKGERDMERNHLRQGIGRKWKY